MDADLLADLTLLPEMLVPDHDTLCMLASCYVVCQAHFAEISNLNITNAAWHRRYEELQASFAVLLQVGQHPQAPHQHTALALLRGALSAAQRQEALAGCAALLGALSLSIAGFQRTNNLPQRLTTRASAPLGQTEILISLQRPSAVALAQSRLPRQPADGSDMLAKYHQPLHVTPTNVGDWRLVARALHPTIEGLFATRIDQQQIHIAVSPLTMDAALQGTARPGFPGHVPARFVVQTVGDETAQLQVLQQVLRQCYDQGIAILVLPELRVPPSFQRVIQAFLRQQVWADLQAGKGLLLVVAGSWHEQEDTTWVNRSHVFDARGRVVWTHDKLAEYHILAEEVQEHPGLKQQLGVNDHGGVEAITKGQDLQFCDCALGRLAVAICIGFFHAPLRPLLEASGANIFLVPTMTKSMRRLEERASDLVASQHAATFAANCGTIARDPAGQQIPEKTACFYMLPAANAGPRRFTGDPTVQGYLHVYTLQ